MQRRNGTPRRNAIPIISVIAAFANGITGSVLQTGGRCFALFYHSSLPCRQTKTALPISGARLLFLLLCKQSEVQQYDDAKYNAVPAEYLEVMLADIIHQEADAEQGNPLRFRRRGSTAAIC